MNSEAEKMALIRRYLLRTFPSWQIEDGSRTDVDRTVQLFEGVNLKCTIQIGMDLLLDTHLAREELEVALEKRNLPDLVRSSSVVYLKHNTLGLQDS